jgi:hypothetical protein
VFAKCSSTGGMPQGLGVDAWTLDLG